jgi:hypothetical protein
MRKAEQKTIAHNIKMHEVFISRVKTGKRYTEREDLAVALSRLTGKPAIGFIAPRLRKVYLRANPALKKVST